MTARERYLEDLTAWHDTHPAGSRPDIDALIATIRNGPEWTHAELPEGRQS